MNTRVLRKGLLLGAQMLVLLVPIKPLISSFNALFKVSFLNNYQH